MNDKGTNSFFKEQGTDRIPFLKKEWGTEQIPFYKELAKVPNIVQNIYQPFVFYKYDK